jgi:hypothetical protein
MHTEDEAKKLWCPHVRLSATRVDAEPEFWPAWNRASEHHMGPLVETEQVCCIASKCMAWRWEKYLAVFELDPDLSAEVNTEKGYCGLAGKP